MASNSFKFLDPKAILGLWPSKWLPSRLFSKQYATGLDLPKQLPKELTLKIADDRDEFEEAFEIIKDELHETQLLYTNSCRSNLYVNKHHALADTRVIVAKWNDEVVGTLSLFFNGPMLPSKRYVELESWSDGVKHNYCEMTLLAFRPQFGSRVFWPLLKYALEYQRLYTPVDVCISSQRANESLSLWLKNCLNFKPIADDSNFLWFDFEKSKYQLLKKYWGKTHQKDLFSYLFRSEFPQLKFPSLDETSVKPPLKPEDLHYFFAEKSDVFENLSEFEKFCIADSYKNFDYDGYLPKFDMTNLSVEDRRKATNDRRSGERDNSNDRRRWKDNREVRFNISASASAENHDHPFDVLDISLNGLRASTNEELVVGETCQLNIKVEDYTLDSVGAKVVWAKKKENTYGFRIDAHSQEWFGFIHHLIDKKVA